ncbi:MAG: hypothetical protein SR3Q1_00080 [Quinella sp. 3Q1]|nr:hypothetical protein [Quinella sp. 3Q1]MBR3051410.1 hypothetical protein [Selenomonadaceae bacterium]MBR6887447.1 hypothetical protein [Selenomonadaceae bacterium]
MKARLTLFGIISLLLVGIFIAGCGGEKYDKNVQLVRNGTLKMNPNVPIGKAFDQFFANGKWKSFTSTENKSVVEFNGDCSWYNAPAKMTIQFIIVEENAFNLEYVGINDVAMNLFESTGIVEKVLSEYKK